MTQEPASVLIVGAGSAGLSLLLLLQQQGIASLLIERRADVSWHPRARNLNFRTLEVFRGIGLEAKVVASGAHVTRTLRKQTVASHEEEAITSVADFLHIADRLEICTPEPPFLYCPQSRLEPLMLAEAKQRGCDVRYNTELISFTQDSQGVTATIKDRGTGACTVVQASYLVGADGAHSKVRDALGVKADGLGVLDERYIFIYFRADWGELIEAHENDAIFIDRPNIRGFFLITDRDRGMFAIQEESAHDYSVEHCKELVIDGIGKPDLPIEIIEVARWQPAQLVAERFAQGYVFLVGDAAHTMPPKLGMGANTAIQSAHNLAWKLAAVLKGQAPPALLATYQAERRPVGLLASQQSLVGPAATLLTKGSDDKLLPAERRVSLFSLIAGYRYHSQAVLSEDVAVAVETDLLSKPEELTGQPGTRVPHLWLEREGKRISTLDLPDGRFVLLTGTDGAAWGEAAAAVAARLGIGLSAYRIGPRGGLLDLEDGWRTRMSMGASGVILLRPDGFVAWRARVLPASHEDVLEQVLMSILCRVPATP